MKKITKQFVICLFLVFFSLFAKASTNTEKNNARELNENAANFLHKDPNLSLTLAKSALRIAIKNNDKEAETESLFNIGMAFYIKGVYAKALENHFEAKKKAEKIENKKSIGDVNIGIGLVYHDQGKTTLSKQYFRQAYYSYKKANYEKGIAHSLNMLGYSFSKENNSDSAIYYYNQTLLVCQKINDPQVLASVYQDLAASFVQLNKYNEAIKYHNLSLKYSNVTGSAYNIAHSLNGLGEIFLFQDKAIEAEAKYNEALKIEIENELQPLMEKTYKGLSQVYLLRKNYQKAHEYQGLYIVLKDSLFNAKTNNTISVLESDISKERERARTLFLIKENQYKELELDREKRIKYFYIGIAFLALLNLLMMFNRLNIKKNSNQLLLAKNKKISKQKKKIQSINKQLALQRKHVNDSIEYAYKIQKALMPSAETIKTLFTQVSILYKPLKIVSGDFYWCYQNNKYIYLVLADCTGHGVPGAFMSIIGIKTLNQLVEEKGLIDAKKIIRNMDELIRNSLKQDDNNIDLSNSMDLSICVFNTDNNTLDYAGAKRPLLYYANKQMNVIKGSHFSVGGNVGVDKSYTSAQIKLEKGNRFYLFTDGITDQFGGEKGKRINTPKIVDLLTKTQHKSIELQKIEVSELLISWAKNETQTDDQLFIAVEV